MMDTDYKVLDIQKFDISLTDIKSESIKEMEICGAKHLSVVEDTTGCDSSGALQVLNGITSGDYSGVLVKAVLSAGRSLNAIMLVDTSSLCMFLTDETLRALGISAEDQPNDQTIVLINRHCIKELHV